MKKSSLIALLLPFLTSGQVVAEVTAAEPGGFTTVTQLQIEAPRDAVWKASVDEISSWWHADHTVSGDAARLSITSVPQGCFCERLDSGGGVVHMTVTMVNPGVVIRYTGGLGPLGLMGVNGNMTWEYEDVDSATGVTFTYAVGGYLEGGLDKIAGPVDAVIGEALSRLKAHIENGDADSVSGE